MTQWLAWLRELAGRMEGEPAALVSVLATEGSAPRGAGTRMLVTARGLAGTVGGGALEHQAIAQARALLAEPTGSWRVQDYPLGPLLGQCCGGRVRLLIEHVDPAALGWLGEAADGRTLVTVLAEGAVTRELAEGPPGAAAPARGERPGVGARLAERLGGPARPLYLFGAGHVGQAVARHAAGLPLALAWFDTRDEQAQLPGVTLVADDALGGCIDAAPMDAAIVIMTHDHPLDYALVLAALTRAPVAYVGMIGSATKAARFRARLARDGVAADAVARLVCPIGVPGTHGKEPDVIAIATLAQLLQLGPAEAR